MRLCTFRTAGGPPEGWPGRVDGDRIIRLDAPDLIAVLARRGQVADAAALPADGAELLAPVPRPPSVRDFFAFEQHVATARANRGAEVPAEWYEFPAFYFTNPAAVYGPGAEISYPAGTAALDYELEVAAVIGADGQIGGFTIMNDWSARDIQRKEMRVGLGPAKAKDFATSLGPVLVTPDEFDGTQAVMTARVNGEERSRGDLADLYYPWPDILEQAARNTVLRPGDVIGSGTVGTGCILEHDDGRWLVPGDTVELEVAGLGVLRNRVGAPRGLHAPGAPEMTGQASGTTFDVIVIGAGLVGLATAMALLGERPALRLAVLEKEPAVGTHQSGHNSGVIHAGLYYQPGSLKARFCTAGRLALMEFAEAHQIPYRQTGKLVVASRDSELPRLADLAERGRANGLAVREIGPAEISEIEPSVRGLRALHTPESGVIDYRQVSAAYAGVVTKAGGQVLSGHGVQRITRRRDGWVSETAAGPLLSRTVVACAGLQADRIAAMTGQGGRDYRIVPFRGDYYTFRAAAADLVRGLVYPVPDPAFPFLGVHFTRGIDGTLHAGPNAVPALAREGYGRLSVSGRDLLDSLRFPGLRRLARRYAGTGALEIWRDLVKPAYLAEMRRYIPGITSRDITFGPSGIRAQCLSRSGALVDDFLIEEGDGVLHVLNAPSPAATASLVIGKHIAGRAAAQLAS